MQITRERLNQLSEALKRIPIEAKVSFSNYMHLSPSEFELFCDEIPNMSHEDIESEHDFEQQVEQYLTEQFFDTTAEWQKTILTAVLANFDRLDATVINECLQNADQLLIEAKDLQLVEEIANVSV